MRVLLTGGGTGGHVYPALAVAAALRELQPDVALTYVGTPDGMEANLVPRTGLPYVAVPAGALRGRSIVGMAKSGIKLVGGLRMALRRIHEFRPDVLLATGGYVCAPVVTAAKLAGVPSLIYLPDIEPGLAVKMLARLADRIAVSFEASEQYLPKEKVVVTGYPVRPEIRAMDRQTARERLELPSDATVLLVFGGSRGAQTINRAVEAALPDLLELGYLIHLSGTDDEPRLRARLSDLAPLYRERYRLYPYLHEEIAAAFAAADLVVCRAGASTLGELPAFGLPSVLVPYPYAGAHQWQNANYLASRGAAVALSNDAVQEGALLPTVRDLMQDQERLARMRAASRALARPEAARNIAQELLRLARHR